MATLGTPTVNVGTRHQLDPVGSAWLKRPFLGRFAAMIAVSEAVRTRLLAGGLLAPERVVTIRHGIEPPAAAPDRQQARRRLGLAADAEVVGFVGRLCPDKGLPVLLAAVAALRARRPRLQLAIVGDGERGGGHGRRLRARAAAAGPGRRGALPRLPPGRRGSLRGLRPAGGAVAGRAVRAGDPGGDGPGRAPGGDGRGGIPEIVRAGRDGLLVAPGDAAALAGALDRLLADPDWGPAWPPRRRDACAGISPAAGMLDAIEAVYRRALRERAPAPSPASTARPAPRHR